MYKQLEDVFNIERQYPQVDDKTKIIQSNNYILQYIK